MINLHSMGLKNIILFDKIDLPIDQNDGLVVIQGLNLDSHEPLNTNGAGKSLLFSALSNVLFEATPLSAKKTNKKDLLAEKKSSITLEYTGVNSVPYTYIQESSKYTVIEDGKDLGIGKQEVAKQKLALTFPLSPQEFYSTCYVQNLKPLEFQHSTDTDRLKFLTDMFDLHIFDHIRQQAHSKLKLIKDAEIEFKTLSSQIDEVLRQKAKADSKSISDDKVAALKGSEDSLKSKLKKFLKAQQKLEDLQGKLDQIISLSEKNHKLTKFLPKKKNLKKFLKTQLKLHSKYENYTEAKEEFEKATKSSTKLVAKLEKSLGENTDADLDTIRDDYEKLQTLIDSVGDKLRKNKNLVGERSELQEDIKSQKKALAKLDVPSKTIDRDDIAVFKNTVSTYNKLKRHDHDDSCPTRGSDIDLKAMAKVAKKAQTKLDQYATMKEAIEIQEDIADLEKQLKKLAKPKDIKKLGKELDAAVHKADELENIGIELKQYQHEQKILAGLTKPKKATKPDSKYDEDELESFQEAQGQLEIVHAKLETFSLDDDRDVTELRADISKLNADIESTGNKLDKVQEKLSLHRVNCSEIKLLTKQSKKLHKSLKGIEAVVEERRLYEYLYKKYNANDLKLRAASSIMGILQTSLNTYSNLVFVEKTEFRIGPSKQGVIAQYKTSKNVKWADIRSLSGAETNCFRLLFAIALLPLIPEHRRTNFIVLDEPDAACSDVTRQRLIKDFLPKLRSIVPHVFWITPKETDSFKEAEIWTVVKENGASTLKIG